MSNNETTNKPPRMRGHRPMGGPGGRGPVEKAKDVKGTTKKLGQRLSSYKIAIIIVMIFAIGSTIFSIVGPKILGNATTEIYTGLMNKINRTGGIDFAKIGKIILFALGLYGVSALFSMIQSYIMAGVAQKVTYKIRNELTEKIDELAGVKINLSSPKQVADLLFNKLMLPSNKKQSTSIEILNNIKHLHPIVPLLIEYRKYSKLISFYII